MHYDNLCCQDIKKINQKLVIYTDSGSKFKLEIDLTAIISILIKSIVILNVSFLLYPYMKCCRFCKIGCLSLHSVVGMAVV